MLSLGLFMQAPGLLVELSTPVDFDEIMRQPLAEVLPKLMQAMQTSMQLSSAVQPLAFVGWVAITAAGLGLARTALGAQGEVATQLDHEALPIWLRRTAAGLLPAFVVGLATLVGGLAGLVALLAPLGIAWLVGALAPLSQGGVLQAMQSHPGLGLIVLAYCGVVLSLGLVVVTATLMMVGPMAVGLQAPWGTRLRQSWQIGLRHAMRLTMIVFWCQLLGGVVALAAGMAKLLANDAMGMALGVGLGAWVAPLPALAAVLVYREDMPVNDT